MSGAGRLPGSRRSAVERILNGGGREPEDGEGVGAPVPEGNPADLWSPGGSRLLYRGYAMSGVDSDGLGSLPLHDYPTTLVTSEAAKGDTDGAASGPGQPNGKGAAGADEPLATTSADTLPLTASDAYVGTAASTSAPAFKTSPLHSLRRRWFLRAPPKPRTVYLESGDTDPPRKRLPDNAVRNTKYNALTFFPRALYEEFRMFYNLFFLAIAISQVIPALRVGYLITYIGPLAFVLTVSLAKSAFDDLMRRRRDDEVNRQLYERLGAAAHEPGERRQVRAADIRVGDLLLLHKDQRVPADCVLLRAAPDPNGTVFLRTDQLDGETDWKLRRAVHSAQQLRTDEDLIGLRASVWAEAPRKEIYEFIGNLYLPNGVVEPLSLENTMWAGTVLASGSAVALVVYTGRETRSMMNVSQPPTKVGALDLEVNFLSKLLFVLLFSMAFILLCFKRFGTQWFLYLVRYLLLFSSIIPISMRINLDLSKYVYKFMAEHDRHIPQATVRNSDIPEELGRLDYVLTDKTGTLTKNEMVFKKVHFGSVLFGRDSLEDLRKVALAAFAATDERSHRDVREALLAVALAHNVTPVEDAYQAASPDEVALLQFANSIGLQLLERSQSVVRLRLPTGAVATFDILVEFPFTPAAKRMGIVVRGPLEPTAIPALRTPRPIWLFVKGADSVLARMARATDWLDEECGNMAREGLRTLVYGRRLLTEAQYREFAEAYREARAQRQARAEAMAAVQTRLERDLDVMCLTGVEDVLQDGVKETLEQLRQAEFRVWMLTGDKVETARCIATSSRLVSRQQRMFTISGVDSRTLASRQLAQFKRRANEALVVDGVTLDVMLQHFGEDFMHVAGRAPAVIACRCSPTQKGELARLIRQVLHRRVLAIGDGGNDVAMIQKANVGVGIPGREGRQASMAADFSVAQFAHLVRLLLWHGRNNYKRSARLAQFVVHRGLIIAVIQMCFSAFFYFAAISVFSGLLMVGFATVFTMLPIFSLVLDEDVSDTVALTYPELYTELRRGRSLNVRTFLTWVLKAFYSGAAIMAFAVLILYNAAFFTTANIQAVAFTALVFLEWLMVVSEIHTWHYLMIVSEALSVLFYALAILLLRDDFDQSFVWTFRFWWKTLVIVLVAWLPVEVGKRVERCVHPPRYAKVGRATAREE